MRKILKYFFILLFLSGLVLTTHLLHMHFHGKVKLTGQEKVWLQQHDGKIRIAPDPYWPPIEFFDADGQYRGISANYIDIIKCKLGVEFQIVRYNNWDEVIRMTKDRQVDVLAGTTYSPSRSKYLDFTEPYIEIPCVIITRVDTPGYKALEELAGKKVAVGAGYVLEEYLRRDYPNTDLIPVYDIRTGLRKVSFGEVDAFVGNIASISYFIEKERITNLKIAGETQYSVKLAFASRNDLPILNSIFKKALASISPHKQNDIYRKWIRPASQPF